MNNSKKNTPLNIYFSKGYPKMIMCITLHYFSISPFESTASIEVEMSYSEPWKCSSMLSLSLMKTTMTKNIRPSMPKTDNTTKFMLEVNNYSQSNIVGKLIVRTLISELTTKKCNRSTKSKLMGMHVSESFLVQFIINSLPSEFDQ